MGILEKEMICGLLDLEWIETTAFNSFRRPRNHKYHCSDNIVFSRTTLK